jgi:mRNA interferase MazF
VRRGEVWWADLPKPASRRPVLLLSRDSAYKVRTSVTVAPIARKIRSIPTEVRLGRSDGMQDRCVANLDSILTVPKSVLSERVTELAPEKMLKIREAILFALDLEI